MDENIFNLENKLYENLVNSAKEICTRMRNESHVKELLMQTHSKRKQYFLEGARKFSKELERILDDEGLDYKERLNKVHEACWDKESNYLKVGGEHFDSYLGEFAVSGIVYACITTGNDILKLNSSSNSKQKTKK